MAPLVEFDHRSAVLYWLTDKKRRHKDTPKATQQDWFRQVLIIMQMTVVKSQIFSQQLPENDCCIECIH